MADDFEAQIKQKARTFREIDVIKPWVLRGERDLVYLDDVLAVYAETQRQQQEQLQELFAKFKQEVISDCFDSGDMGWLRQEFLKFEKSVLSPGSSVKKVEGLEHG